MSGLASFGRKIRAAVDQLALARVARMDAEELELGDTVEVGPTAPSSTTPGICPTCGQPLPEEPTAELPVVEGPVEP